MSLFLMGVQFVDLKMIFRKKNNNNKDREHQFLEEKVGLCTKRLLPS